MIRMCESLCNGKGADEFRSLRLEGKMEGAVNVTVKSGCTFMYDLDSEGNLSFAGGPYISANDVIEDNTLFRVYDRELRVAV